MSFLLLNDGSSKVLLNDGSSAVLLNVEDAVGLTLSGSHSTQGLYQKSPEIKTPVHFSFKIKAGIIPLVFFAQVTFDKMFPYSFDSKILRNAFVLPIQKMEFRMKNIKMKYEKEFKLLTIGNLLSMASESDIIRLIGQLFKK